MEDGKMENLCMLKTSIIGHALDELCRRVFAWKQNHQASSSDMLQALLIASKMLRALEELVLDRVDTPHIASAAGSSEASHHCEDPSARQAVYHICSLLACLPRTTFAQLKVSMQEEDFRNEFPFYAAELDLLSASRACLEASFYREQKVRKGCSP